MMVQNILDHMQTQEQQSFFYYPAYSGTYYYNGAGAVNVTYNDKIVFNNLDDIPVSLFIMKQQPPGSEGVILADLYSKELLYRPTVQIRESSAVMSPADRHTDVYTNLLMNLQDGSALTPNSDEFKFAGTPVFLSQLNENVKELYNGNVSQMQPGDYLMPQKNINRFFDATVAIYEKGAADNDFPPEMRLTYLDSTKINDN